jgi:hypothetical protein
LRAGEFIAVAGVTAVDNQAAPRQGQRRRTDPNRYVSP